jgi:hypothetical protein
MLRLTELLRLEEELAMPIDFARIAALYRAPIMMRAKTMSEALQRLGEWLKKRLLEVRATELATRAFPVIRFYNEAVTMWIDRSQHGLLTPNQAAPSLGESFREGGRRFVRGLSRVGDAIEEELAIPRLTGTFSGILQTIVDAMDRYPEPTPAMFDIRAPWRVSDLFGQGALFFRAFTSSLNQVNSFASEGHQLYAMFGSSSENESPTNWPTLMRDAVRQVVGAILLVPIATRLFVTTLNSLILIVKIELLRQFQEIEAEVFALRREVIDFFYTSLGGFGPKAFDFLLATQLIVMENVGFYFRFTTLYLHELLGGIRFFALELSTFLRFFTRIIEGVRRTLEAILNIDLMPIFLAAIGVPSVVLSALPIPTLTIDDLISLWLGLGRVAVRESLDLFLGALANHPIILGLSIFTSIRSRIKALQRLLRISLTARPFIRETALPPPFARFPDIFAAFFGPGAPNIAASMATATAELQASVAELFTAGHDFLLNTSEAMRRAAARAATLGSPSTYALLAERAEQLSSQVFGPMAGELRQRIAGHADSLARSFERFVAGGAFDVIGSVIPLYVEQMSGYWLERTEEEATSPTPTSPHILARRAGLRRVRFPRLIIRAPGRALDADLITRIAERFKAAIENSYVTGLAQAERATRG